MKGSLGESVLPGTKPFTWLLGLMKVTKPSKKVVNTVKMQKTSCIMPSLWLPHQSAFSHGVLEREKVRDMFRGVPRSG
jgi:hypothetical protein